MRRQVIQTVRGVAVMGAALAVLWTLLLGPGFSAPGAPWLIARVVLMASALVAVAVITRRHAA